jgi:hypothetical protein
MTACWHASGPVHFDPTLADVSDRDFIQKLRNDPSPSLS